MIFRPLTKERVLGSRKGLSFYGFEASTELEMRFFEAGGGGVEDPEREKEGNEERGGDGE